MKTRLLMIMTAMTVLVSAAQPQTDESARIPVIYEPATNPAHEPIVQRLRQRHVLENVRKYFLPYRLPRPLTLKTTGCKGEIDAWYTNDVITVCYEYLEYVLEVARSKDRPSWVSEADATLGPIVDLFLHEGAHAIFEYFEIPILGQEEDAADQVATYSMLDRVDEFDQA